MALEQSERPQEALAAHQRALSLAPDNAATLTNLGMYYATHGDPAQAEPLLRKAAAAPGAGPQERQNLALVLGLEGRYDEAERLARQDLPPAAVDNNLAYLHATATLRVRIPGIRCGRRSRPARPHPERAKKFAPEGNESASSSLGQRSGTAQALGGAAQA